jgi:hypothetical protein
VLLGVALRELLLALAEAAVLALLGVGLGELFLTGAEAPRALVLRMLLRRVLASRVIGLVLGALGMLDGIVCPSDGPPLESARGEPAEFGLPG